ncbi:CASP-like protein 1E1 [Cucurbita pepo subsp. pepo]|uniref:CASP-like protein 1E1 n=1 Tax=Cucurbita pepo subsp. pepo TaxID=3664 RepID=UPI000C9D7FC5|nr:CASP-like protein 1E1 [Cucurbita pepo subsp. pepo]
MDGQRKAGFGVSDGSETTTTARFCDLILRFVAMILTLAAAVVIGVDKQAKTVSLQLTAALPPLRIPVTARWHYSSAFVYFVVVNAIACSYAAFSLVLSAVIKGKGRRSFIRSAITVMDLLTVALLFSGFGAAAAVGVIGLKGNSHLNWNKICDVFGRFCGQGAASLLLSLLGATSFLSLAVLSALRLPRGSN